MLGGWITVTSLVYGLGKLVTVASPVDPAIYTRVRTTLEDDPAARLALEWQHELPEYRAPSRAGISLAPLGMCQS